MSSNNQPLKICILSYRSNPHCGGQGVYLARLSRALMDLGHRVDVLSGPPYPILDNNVKLSKLPSLDLYNPDNLFRVPSFRELMDPVNLFEWVSVSTQGFPEPYTFGMRARKKLKNKCDAYDVVHDNQSLSYGLLSISKNIPTIATIHHPITRDRQIDIESVRAPWKKIKHMRWYSFLGMQKKVARKLPYIITVSECAKKDISADFKVPLEKFRIVPNGIDTNLFCPIPEIEREKNRLIVTNSADTPLKGLKYLLIAVSKIAKTRMIKMTVVGTPKENGSIERLISRLGIGYLINFTGRISDEEFVRHYARASIAVVPSIYEGFGLPSGEAMACGLPVISTTGGALPEVVGDAGILIPPADTEALVKAILELMDNRDKARALGEKGHKRVHDMFTWRKAAINTVNAYREAICDHSRL